MGRPHFHRRSGKSAQAVATEQDMLDQLGPIAWYASHGENPNHARTTDAGFAPSIRVLFDLDRHYNSAWLNVARSGRAGLWDSAMSTDHSASSEQRLPLHEGDLLTITDAIPIDITVLAADGAVLYVNQYAIDR